jgi:hypothetical protein
MTPTGWLFMGLCWTVLVVVTAGCYRLLLRQK